MIQSYFKYLFTTSVKCSDYKTSPFVHKLAKTYPFRGRGFHTPVEWKIGYKIINKQVIIQILFVNIAFYIYGNIRLKEISIMDAFDKNTRKHYSRLGFFGSARQLGRGFHTRPPNIKFMAKNWSDPCNFYSIVIVRNFCLRK